MRQRLRAAAFGMMFAHAAATAHAQSANTRDNTSGVTCGLTDNRVVECRQQVRVSGADPDATVRPLSSVSLEESDLRAVGSDMGSQVDFARAMAGADIGTVQLYVDGIPTATPPPGSSVARLTVNGDPFSAEVAGVDRIRVAIDLRAPERRWRIDWSPPSLTSGGASPLAPTGRPLVKATSGGVSGPLPWSPLTFSAYGSRTRDASTPVLSGASSAGLSASSARTTSDAWTLTAGVAYTAPKILARATLFDSRGGFDHAGIGGINDATTGSHIASTSTTLQMTWRTIHGPRVARGALVVDRHRLASVADTAGPSIVVTGQSRTGNDLSTDLHRASGITASEILESRSSVHSWKIGLEATTQTAGDARDQSAWGRLQLASPDSVTGTWIVTRGRQAAAASTAAFCLFGEAVIVRTPRLAVRAGLRIDRQARYQAVPQPRISTEIRVAGFQASAAGGLFFERVNPSLLVSAYQEDGRATTLVVRDVAPAAIPSFDPSAGEELRARIAHSFSPRRDAVARAALQRNVHGLQAAIEETWTFGESLTGTLRTRDAAGLLDTIDSDRRLRRRQFVARGSLRQQRTTLTAHYTFTRSVDDADGFVVPAVGAGVAGEWAPTTAVPRHIAGVAAIALLPGHVRATTMVDARAGLPVNVITGQDPDGMGTFTDRGGLPRNAGVLPPSWKVTATAMRTVRARWLKGAGIDLGIRADNLLDRVNIISVGRVLGSPAFGHPMSAGPRRLIAIWAAANY